MTQRINNFESQLRSAPVLFRDIGNHRNEIIVCIEHALARQLTNTPTAAGMAAMFCVSKRTFNRKLNAMGVSYRELQDNVKSKVARKYLLASERSITDIAAELGYADPSNFTKAFKSWQGCSPREYRATHAL